VTAGWDDVSTAWEELKRPGGTIIYLIIDGVGGAPDPEFGGTELEVANTPHMDDLARSSSCGLLEIVGPGITPGSGPGHLALFGYDPFRYQIGRGILSALGIGFDLQIGDVAARVNFATVDETGAIANRRAGRIDDDTNRRLCQKLSEHISLDFDGRFFMQTVKEHRALFVLRGESLRGHIEDTDPQVNNCPPRPVRPLDNDSQAAARLVQSFVEQAGQVLADEYPANMVLLRGFDSYQPLPSLRKRFGLRGQCIAQYPMYRGVSRLVGLDVYDPVVPLEKYPLALAKRYEQYDFHFLHVKPTDSKGEDGDFAAKVKIIEQVDNLVPDILAFEPDVMVITADHSTPAVMAQHSWHPVPVLIHAANARADGLDFFNERCCQHGSLGLRPAVHLMGLALAHAGRLDKFGA